MKKNYSFTYLSLILVFLNTISYCASAGETMPIVESQLVYNKSIGYSSSFDSIKQDQFPPKSITDDCHADFTWESVDNNPLAIRFVNNSTGLFYWVNWSFGDGQSSAVYDPVHFYSVPGVYQVCLSIGDLTKSCYDQICKTIVVPVPTNCQAAFSHTIDNINPFKVYFFGYTGSDADSLHWDFGDGFTSSELNPTHIFADTGYYNVRFSAANRLDTVHCHTIYEELIHIKGPDCLSSFLYTINPYNPIEVSFETIPHGSADNVYWDFGDGRTEDEFNPTHLYNDTGTYLVKHKVWNSQYPDYCIDSSYQEIILNVVPCAADFTYTYDTLYPLRLQFKNTSAGSPNEFLWYFGDETSGEGASVDHNYSTWGTYPVCLIINNTIYPGLCQDTICKDVVIEPFNCRAVIGYLQDSLKPLHVQFRSLGEGPADKFLWEFGDGEYSVEKNPYHVYADTGDYKVKLTVSNTMFMNCCFSDTLIDLKLHFPKLPTADFDYYLDTLTATPRLYYFKDQSEGTNIKSWRWNFGDGETDIVKNPFHRYLKTQNYTVCLEAIDSIPPRYVLKDKVCKEIRMKSYLDLGGSIYDSNLPINNPYAEGDTAKVILFRQFSPVNIQPIDTGYFSHLGYYWFRELLSGVYIVKGELTATSHQARQFFPTYALSELSWSSAKRHELTSNIYDADIHLVKKENIVSGPGTIDGITMQVDAPSSLTGKTIGNIDVILCKEDLTPIDVVKSDVTGHFYFYGLPLGTYKLIADKPGMLSTTEIAKIDIQYPAAGNVVVKLYYPTVIGIDTPIDEADFSITPNPVNKTADIHLPRIKGMWSLKVYNSVGMFTGLSYQTNDELLSLNTEALAEGLYLLVIIDDAGRRLSRKFLKIN